MTEAEAVAALARKGAIVLRTETDREFIALGQGYTLTEVTDEHGQKCSEPRYIGQTVELQTTDSLVEYVTRFKTEATVIFSDIDTNRIVAAIDYHRPENAAHVAHRTTLTLSHSIEWMEWSKISGRLMEQLDFARFIEENGADVAAPDAAELLECVRDLQAHRKVNFTKAVRTSSENENFEYSEETEAKTKRGGIEIPTKFKLAIPVYFGEPDTELFAFLRWRLGDGNLTLGIQLHRAEHVRQAVFKQIVLAIADRTQCPAMFGKIE